MSEYKLLSQDKRNFENTANEIVKNGYKPVGGICVTQSNGSVLYAQSFFKEAPAPDSTITGGKRRTRKNK
jgi:hypothetical protein